MIRWTILLLLVLPVPDRWLAGAQAAPEWETAMAALNAEFEQARTGLLDSYRDDLLQFAQRSQEQREINDLLAARSELKRLAAERRLAKEHVAAGEGPLPTLQHASIEKLTRLWREDNKRRSSILKQAVSSLEAEKVQFVRNREMEKAIAVHRRIQQLQQPPKAKKAKPSTPSDPFAKIQYTSLGTWSIESEKRTGKRVALNLSKDFDPACTELAFTYAGKGYKPSSYTYGPWNRQNLYQGVTTQKTFPGVAGRFVRYQTGIDVMGLPFSSLAEFNLLNPAGERLSRANWSIFDATSQAGLKAGVENILDGLPTTRWHSSWEPMSNPPHVIVVDLGKEVDVGGVSLQMRRDGLANGMPAEITLWVSNDVQAFGEPVYQGRLFPQNVAPFEVFLADNVTPTTEAEMLRTRQSFTFEKKESALYRFQIPPAFDRETLTLGAITLDLMSPILKGRILQGIPQPAK